MNRDTIEVMGLKFAVTFDYDQNIGAPWDWSDGHGPVRIGRKHADGQSDKRPGERPLNKPGWRENQYYYDWAEACRMARRDWWNAAPYDAPDRAHRAVQADFDYLSGWVNGEWHYVVVGVCQVDDDGAEIGDWDYLGGVETYKDYHHECACEMAEQLAKQIIREAQERAYWESRDVETV